jgi:type II restriction/modification system DNA methylase subunit YeeA
METSKLKKFAQYARRSLMEQVSAKLKVVLTDDSPARRESIEAVRKLEEAINLHGKGEVIERVAYIWFNRFCALHFMDVKRYNRVNIVSPADPGQFQPEILAEAKMGHLDEEMVSEKTRQQIFALLDGKAPSRDPQGEAYRLLVVAVCNFWYKAMPFLFQRIDDYTELLMPDDLLSGNSILAYTREAMTPDACGEGKVKSGKWEVGSKGQTSHSSLSTSHSYAAGGVEVIGWLYQFYISEKKDEVFDGLKKNKKITPENIPAATQLFTPHWIVRYLVENSLGRLWLLNRPGSKLAEKMDYYIKPEQTETDFLRIGKPEEIKICDPACGSGHMLTYAFDLLYAIYEEEGYESAEIPEKILTHNLYGIEIDERAGELAAFALIMKARARQRRFFNKGIKPNICVLENVHFSDGEIKEYMDFVGRDLFTTPLQTTLHQFEEADNFGSLIRPDVTDVGGMLKILESKNVSGQLFLSLTHQKVLQAMRQADYLSPKYHVVIANPPYMGGGGMNGRLKVFSQDNYQDSRADLFAMFIERNLDLAQHRGCIAMITMQSWMFLSSFETLRANLLISDTVLSMVHLGARAFDSIGGEVVSTTAFVIKKEKSPEYKGSYIKLTDGNSEAEKNGALLSKQYSPYFVSAADLKQIPGNPIAYWISNAGYQAFSLPPMSEVGSTRRGLQTGNKDEFIRNWFECEAENIEWRKLSKEDASNSEAKWFQFNNGGIFRKWYGNLYLVVNWRNDGEDIKNSGKAIIPSESLYFKSAVCWARLTTGNNAFRLHSHGVIPGDLSPCFYSHELELAMAYYNSKCANYFLNAINPTITKTVGDVARIPSFAKSNKNLGVVENTKELVSSHSRDWDSFETSWDFKNLPLLNPDYRQPTLKASYQKLRAYWREMKLEMQRLEQENNRIFIEAYGLQDELSPDVSLNEITLTCNPHYRYGVGECEEGSEKWDEMEARLLQDTMKELVSYAVGCMFGRYSLDMPGLVLANQGEGIEEYHRKIEEYRANECKKLSGTDRLAESDRLGGDDLSGHTAISQRGALRTDESDPQGSGVDSLQHSGGSGEAINSRVQELFVDNAGFPSGSGNPSDDRSAIRLSPPEERRTNPEPIRRDQTHDLFSNSEAVLTPHSPLPTSHFLPDDDNVIPMLDGNWFTDDIAERFRKFMSVAFGEEHYEENLLFVEQALNIKGKRNYGIRDYFLSEFYTDHVKRYKKRPIYWLFSSPKGSFNALIYMHRYRPDTVSVVLNDYLREFRTKLTSHKNHLEAVSISASSSQGDKTRALKEIEKITKMISEMEEYEREVLYPLATEQVEIDLDDGVKVNYPKLGKALKKIPGLDAKKD